MKTIQSLLITLAVATTPVAAQTIASRVQYQGTPKHLQVTALNAREGAGLLRVQAEVSNNSGDSQTFFYRAVWLDDTGFQVGGDEPWKPVLVHGNQRQLLQLIAPALQVRDFRIQFSATDNVRDTPTTN